MVHDEKSAVLQQYSDVKNILDSNKILPWDLSQSTMRSAYENINEQATQQFVNEYLLKMIVLITSQSPSKLGLYEKKVVEDSIELAAFIAIKLLPNQIGMLGVVARVFDPTIPFYQGSKVGFTFTAGFPMFRILTAKRFAELHGFQLVSDALERANHWPGCTVLMHILKVMEHHEVMPMIHDSVKARTANGIMQGMLALPDDLMKRENCEVMADLVRGVALMWKAVSLDHKGLDSADQSMNVFFEFWLELVLKLTTSSALVLKLFGWEQLGEIIAEAKLRRTPAESYVVEGAGTGPVNGVYCLSHRPREEDCFQYTKSPTRPDEPLLTLFRCTMRNKSKWWFISQADAEKPGTDKDVDYYVHRTASEEDREPPVRGWTRLNTGISLVGIDPAPLLRRECALASIWNVQKDTLLDRRVLQWAAQKDVLSSVFGASSLHREIVSRSAKLLEFLGQYDSLSSEQLAIVWRAAMQSHDLDVVEEILTQLAATSPLFSLQMFKDMVDLALVAVQQQPENYGKVVQFLEKFALEGGRLVLSGSLHAESTAHLLSLVWETYRNASYSDLKSGVAIQDLLSLMLRQRDGAESAYVNILACAETLRKKAFSNPSRGESSVSVLRELHILQFLLAKHCDSETAERLETNASFSEGLISEVLRYVAAQREAESDGAEYLSQLTLRLQTLRRFFLISPAVSMSLERVASLWAALSKSASELDEFFLFLQISHSVHVHNVTAPLCVCSPEVAQEVFRLYICSTTVDWALCGKGALECFSAYFAQLDSSRPEQTGMNVEHTSLRDCGLQTLWRIALDMTAAASVEAVEWLVKAYGDSSEEYLELLRVVFVHLHEIAENTETIALDSARHLRLTRCIGILHAAIAKSKGVPGVAHSVRGRMGRIGVTVCYRRVSSHVVMTHLESARSEKGSEGRVQLEVHPCFTVLQFKEKLVRTLAVFKQADNIVVEHFSRKLSAVRDSTRLFELDVSDGSEISVTYQAVSYMSNNRVTDRDVDVDSSICTHIGLLLSQNLSQFDCLLTLCEKVKAQNNLASSIWDLVMLLPTQSDLQEETLEQVLLFEDVSSHEDGVVAKSWSREVLENGASATRTAYLLQVVDSFLQPASELLESASDDYQDKITLFREAFVVSGGFSSVLNILIATPTEDDLTTNSTTLAVSLHIIYFLLYDCRSGMVPSGVSTSMMMNEDDDDEEEMYESIADVAPQTDTITSVNTELLELVERQSSLVIDRLMHVAKHAAANEESSVVHNALTIITTFIRTPEVALQLTSNPESRSLLTTVLRSGSKKVRDLAGQFAVQIGKSQPVVFGWLLDQLQVMSVGDHVHCEELFAAIATLFCSSSPSELHVGRIADILSNKLLAYPVDKDVFSKTSTVSVEEGSAVLLGYLELFNEVLALYPKVALKTALGLQLVPVFLDNFLFTLPFIAGHDRSWLCDTPVTRKAAFNVLTTFLDISVEGFEAVLAHLSQLVRLGSRNLRHSWSVQVQHDVRKSDMHFAGLKNQGCTCYMNSLLQQLFMSNSFRETILATPLRESTRMTMWHRSDEQLVGREALFEYASGEWRCGRVASFDSSSGMHCVEYHSADGSVEETAVLNVRSGRFQKETGRARLVPVDGEIREAVSERDEAAYRVLEQLQRTFCFMKLSKRRYFDPRPFVDACKTLNMNFNVYHQNDAAEFCDQLLDRIETATRGKHSGNDVWTEGLMKEVFGGKWLYEKIPTECAVYSADQADCGHFQGSRMESFLKVELMIRGKEQIAESLQELVQGELMDGDNKIQCDVCCEKKDTVRRTCFGTLPNTLVLHLKRFDLDFQTFETVKLNNRMEFPTSINMLPYTREGIEAEERRLRLEEAVRNAADDSFDAGESGSLPDKQRVVAIEEEANPTISQPLAEDFQYHLQGVLVHAGVAQGGHYYSFVRDDENNGGEGEASGRWYRFEDEDVTPFDPEHIPAQCFGGPPAHSEGSSVHSLGDEDRTSNALMLFYSKAKRVDKADMVSTTTQKLASMSVTDAEVDALVDGTEAFQREVLQSNLQHLLSCILVDPDLHGFVRSLVQLVSQRGQHASSMDSRDLRWPLESSRDDLPLRTVRFTCTFLLDVLLHYRERAAIQTSMRVLKDAFDAHPHTAVWFVGRVLDCNSCGWFHEYMLVSTDTLARASFLQLLMTAVRVISPKDPDALLKLSEQDEKDHCALLCVRLVVLLMETVPKTVNYVRTADEVFMLIRDLAASEPAICTLLQTMGCVSYLSFFVLQPTEFNNHQLLVHFQKHLSHKQSARHEYGNLLQSVLEAMAALLGVPQTRKVNLLQDRTYWESDLVVEAREALTVIFEEVSRDGGMDAQNIVRYFERVGGNSSGFGSQKMTATQVRSMIDRFPTTSDNRLSLDGFLQYHTESASYNPKAVWRDLHAFGFKNDLSRSATFARGVLEESMVSGASYPVQLNESVLEEGQRTELRITADCRRSLSRFSLYEAGMGPSEASTKAIAHRVCFADLEVSIDLLRQALTRLHDVTREVQWGGNSAYMDFVRLQLDLDDGLLEERLKAVLTLEHVGLAQVALRERNHPSVCRANEFNRTVLHDRYINFTQDLLTIPLVTELLRAEALASPLVQYLTGYLKFGLPDCLLTENELNTVKHTMVVVEGAGKGEVDGEYTFMTLKNNAGSFERRGMHNGLLSRFTLYKCSLKNGGFQWFISLTPDGQEPGTTQDIDFYYAIAKNTDKLPGGHWSCLSSTLPLEPAPRVECIRLDSLVVVATDSGVSSSASDVSDRVDDDGDASSLAMAVGEEDDFISDFED